MEDIDKSQGDKPEKEMTVEEIAAVADYTRTLKAWFVNSGKEQPDDKIAAVAKTTLKEQGMEALVRGTELLNNLIPKFSNSELRDPVFKFPEQTNSPVSSEKKPESH